MSNRQDGSVGVIALCLMMFLVIIAAGVLPMVSSECKQSRLNSDMIAAEALAEAGAARAISQSGNAEWKSKQEDVDQLISSHGKIDSTIHQFVCHADESSKFKYYIVSENGGTITSIGVVLGSDNKVTARQITITPSGPFSKAVALIGPSDLGKVEIGDNINIHDNTEFPAFFTGKNWRDSWNWYKTPLGSCTVDSVWVSGEKLGGYCKSFGVYPNTTISNLSLPNEYSARYEYDFNAKVNANNSNCNLPKVIERHPEENLINKISDDEKSVLTISEKEGYSNKPYLPSNNVNDWVDGGVYKAGGVLKPPGYDPDADNCQGDNQVVWDLKGKTVTIFNDCTTTSAEDDAVERYGAGTTWFNMEAIYIPHNIKITNGNLRIISQYIFVYQNVTLENVTLQAKCIRLFPNVQIKGSLIVGNGDTGELQMGPSCKIEYGSENAKKFNLPLTSKWTVSSVQLQ